MRYAVEAVLRRIARSAWCRGCNQIVDLVSPTEAARLATTNPANLFLWIRAGRIHGVNAQGEELVCARSIRRGQAVTGKLSRR
jgi:hypothetical protein